VAWQKYSHQPPKKTIKQKQRPYTGFHYHTQQTSPMIYLALFIIFLQMTSMTSAVPSQKPFTNIVFELPNEYPGIYFITRRHISNVVNGSQCQIQQRELDNQMIRTFGRRKENSVAHQIPCQGTRILDAQKQPHGLPYCDISIVKEIGTVIWKYTDFNSLGEPHYKNV
jgi:hypothetical protein